MVHNILRTRLWRCPRLAASESRVDDMNICYHAYLPRLSAKRFIQRIECEFAGARQMQRVGEIGTSIVIGQRLTNCLCVLDNNAFRFQKVGKELSDLPRR